MHYHECRDQIRIRTRRRADFRGGPLCGNGNAHAKVTKDVSKVLCKECLEKIKGLESYYSTS